VLYEAAGIVDRRNVFAYQFRSGGETPPRPLVIGEYRPGACPAAWRCRLDTALAVEGIGFRRGALFCLNGIGEMNLLVEIPYDAQEVHELAVQGPEHFPA
jgi:hypothetical protein